MVLFLTSPKRQGLDIILSKIWSKILYRKEFFTIDRITESKDKKSYLVYIDNHSFQIGKDRYGKLVYSLAKKCLNDKYRYQDYFEIKDTYAIFFVNTKKYGIKEIYVDIEDCK